MYNCVSMIELPEGPVCTKATPVLFRIYTEPPKETLQSSLLYNSIKRDYIAFLHLVKVVRIVLRTNAKFDPSSVKQIFV